MKRDDPDYDSNCDDYEVVCPKKERFIIADSRPGFRWSATAAGTSLGTGEPDGYLTLTYKYRPGFIVVAGLSRVIADDSLPRVTRFKNSLEEWNGDMTFAYLMTNTTF